jgi:outer membrane lipoprotein-sorting protein
MNKQISFICLVLISGFHLYAQDVQPLTDTTEFISKLKKVSSETNSIKADFTEEKFVSYLKEPQKSTGVFYFKRENKLRWEKNKPTSYIFLVNGDKVRVQENGMEKNVSSFNPVIEKIKEMMLSLVNGEVNFGKEYIPSYFQNETTYVVKLIPKNKRMASIFDYIQLTFSKESMRLKELAFFEKSHDKNVMKFFNDTVNEDLDENLFTKF